MSKQTVRECDVPGCPNSAIHAEWGLRLCEECYLEHENDPEAIQALRAKKTQINNVWTIQRQFSPKITHQFGVSLHRDDYCVLQLWFETEKRQLQVFEALSTNFQLYIPGPIDTGTMEIAGTH